MKTFWQWLETTKESTKIVLVATGSYSPIHVGHVDMFVRAKEWLEEKGYVVLKGIISPNHDDYLKRKLGSKAIPLQKRIDMIKSAISSQRWIEVNSWQAELNPFPSYYGDQDRFAVVDHIRRMYPDAKVLILAGSDTGPSSETGIVDVGNYSFMVVNRENDGVSSTKIRDAMKSGQSASDMLHPDVEKYLKSNIYV